MLVALLHFNSLIGLKKLFTIPPDIINFKLYPIVNPTLKPRDKSIIYILLSIILNSNLKSLE